MSKYSPKNNKILMRKYAILFH